MSHVAPNRAHFTLLAILLPGLATGLACASSSGDPALPPAPPTPEVVEGTLSWAVGDPASGGAPSYRVTLVEADGSRRPLTVSPERFRQWQARSALDGRCVRVTLRPDPNESDAWLPLTLEPCRL